MHKNMRRSLIILYLQETWSEEYSVATRRYIWKLRIKDKIKMMKQREAQRITYNTKQGWRNNG